MLEFVLVYATIGTVFAMITAAFLFFFDKDTDVTISSLLLVAWIWPVLVPILTYDAVSNIVLKHRI